jgi:hypothetical protein
VFKGEIMEYRLKSGGIYKSHSYDALMTDGKKWLPLVDLKVVFPHMENIFETPVEALARAKEVIDSKEMGNERVSN